MNLDQLPAFPGIFDDGGAGNVFRLSENIQLAESVEGRLMIKCAEFILVHSRSEPDACQPVVDQPVPDVFQRCTDPASDCGCQAYATSSGEPVSCRPCDAQACANKVAFCMITGTAPVPPPLPGQAPEPAKPEGVCAVRNAP